MRLITALFALSAVAIGAFWAWLGAPVGMPEKLLGPGEKLYCVSYAPFRDWQSPLDPNIHIDPAQIEDDLSRLAKLTDCVRTYSINEGLDRVAEIAGRHGLKVMLGIWLSGKPEKNQIEIDTAVKIANQYPAVVRAVVAGNEVLLRGELGAADLAALIRSIKARVPMPVTYADVWEFWLQNPALAQAADFVTIHILPYWEDFPIPARLAADHVDSIRARVAQAFPGKEVLIGEVGWPSAGRMRESALPSPINQARVLQEVLAASKRGQYRVNLIEAFDQPWKRALEGTVGGHWGMFDNKTRDFKFIWGEPVSNHPQWPWQGASGIVFAGLIFLSALSARQGRPPLPVWLAVAVIAFVSGATIGWTIENISRESLGVGGWLRSLAQCAAAVAAGPLAAVALIAARPVGRFSYLLGDARAASRDPIMLALTGTLIAVTVLALMAALGLTFDPRYKDFPFAPLTGAVIPFFVLSIAGAYSKGRRGAAEIASAAVLVICAVYIAINVSLANWQSMWFSGLLVLLAITLLRVRGEQD
jgi:exo-beta-1,3-glucanase (GH17 family)